MKCRITRNEFVDRRDIFEFIDRRDIFEFYRFEFYRNEEKSK